MSQSIQLKIEGMTCDHCVRSVTYAVKDVPGVADAKVSLETNSAVIEGDQIDVNRIIEAIEEEGYSASVN
jgi:copper chaperone